MRQNKAFYKTHIMKLNHIIGGSVAIKKQIETFRDVRDLDVMIDKSTLKTISEVLETREDINASESDYFKPRNMEILSLFFNDDSKLDLMITDLSKYSYVAFDGIKFLDLFHILSFKYDLLSNFKVKANNKHKKDIDFILDYQKEAIK